MSIRYLMGFNTTDLPPNFNDRFRSIFRIGIFAGGNVEQTGPLQVGVSPFVAVTCDGGVVRDDLDTQYLSVPPNKPDGVYICLLAKYRDFDEPQLEWKVVEPSCLSTCDNSDCFIIFALVHTGVSNITMIEKYGPHRLDPCNKEDLHTWPTLSSLPSFVDGLVRGECAFVIETRKFYWWDGTQWLPVNCGDKTIVIVSVVSGTVDIDASAGDIFIVDLTGPTTFNAPTNPVNGKTIEFWIYSDSQYPMSWNAIYQGTQSTIPLISSGLGRADRVFYEYQPAHGLNAAQWAGTLRDTENIAIGIGAQTPGGQGNIVIGHLATTGPTTTSAVVIGNSTTVGDTTWFSIAIGSASVGVASYFSLAMCGANIGDAASNSIAIGVGAVVFNGAYNSMVIGNGSSTTSPYSVIIGSNNSVVDVTTIAESNTIVGNDNTVDTGANHNTIIGDNNLAEAGAGYCTLIGKHLHVNSDPDHNFVGGEYTYLRDSGVNQNIAIGMGTGIAFDPLPGATDPPGDMVMLQQNLARSVVLGSKILAEAGSTNTYAIGRNIWVTNGSSHSVVIGETIQLKTSSNSIAIGGCYDGHLQNYDNYQRINIENSIETIAIGHNIDVVDMGQLRTPYGGHADSSTIALGKGIWLTGVYGSGIFGSNTVIGSGIRYQLTSATVGIGLNIAIGTATAAISYGIAIGGGVDVYGDRGIAIGKEAKISSSLTANGTLTADAIAIGSGAQIGDGSQNSIAIGSSASTSGAYAIAIGHDAAAVANQCAIGGFGLDVGLALAELVVNAYDPEVTFSSLESFKIKYVADNLGPSTGDPACDTTIAHKTNILVRLNTKYAGGLRRVYAWDGGDITGLSAAFPNARVLFLAN